MRLKIRIPKTKLFNIDFNRQAFKGKICVLFELSLSRPIVQMRILHERKKEITLEKGEKWYGWIRPPRRWSASYSLLNSPFIIILKEQALLVA